MIGTCPFEDRGHGEILYRIHKKAKETLETLNFETLYGFNVTMRCIMLFFFLRTCSLIFCVGHDLFAEK